MSGLSDLETKTIYEVSKLTSIPRQIMDDFVQSVVMSIFKEFIASYKDPNQALEGFMDYWESNILAQKELEIKTVSSQQGSMTDMLIGMALTSSENLAKFAAEVKEFKEAVSQNVLAMIEDDNKGDDDDSDSPAEGED